MERYIIYLNLKLRSAFYKVLSVFNEQNNLDSLSVGIGDEVDDVYSLGIHLVSDHSRREKSDFNDFYTVTILDTCSPKSLEVKEHQWIHKLSSLCPYGINRANPFSIPLLR